MRANAVAFDALGDEGRAVSDIEYHNNHMLLPTVSQDTLGKWESRITIKHIDNNALAADYSTPDTYVDEKAAFAAAFELGRAAVDSGQHEMTVREIEARRTKPA